VATKILTEFFEKYKTIPIKQRKVMVMKILVFMNFLNTYKIYKEEAEAKKVKRELAENEYYLQRYNEFMRSR
ncbi:MAG: hypothetical protein ACK5B9_06690, partial [Flavobacteriia bacterium]